MILFNRNQPTATNHALVIGGSMAGLLAARILADHYVHVTVLDRDEFPAEPAHRAGVPQSRHAHAILPRGQMIIGELFPGIMDEMKADGAPGPGNIQMVTPMGPLAPMDLPAEADEGISVSRFLLEWHIRHRLSLLENVTLLSGVEVQHLTATPNRERVTGVQVRHRTDNLREETLAADLVVDASGRRSSAPEWLAALGYDAPPEETINSGLGYASRFYKKPADFHNRWDGILINGRPPHNPRIGLILPIENDGWHVTVGGLAGNFAPTDEAGFLEWARQLPDIGLYEAIRDAEPLTPIRGARTPSNRLRRFERLTRWPAGFLITGDAVCCFNPIYGQGMTTSALDAVALRETLEKYGTRPGFERKFQQAVAHVVATPWFVATGEDLRWAGVELTGGSEGVISRWRTKVMHRYTNLLLKQATVDPLISGLYFAVIGMILQPRMFMHPGVVARVLWGTARRALRRQAKTLAVPALDGA